MTTETDKDYEGRDRVSGRFVAGNKVATRNKGNAKKMRARLFEIIEKGIEAGKDWQEVIYDASTDPTLPKDIQLKAGKMVNDVVYQEKTIEIDVDEDAITNEQLTQSILSILGRGQSVTVAQDEGEKEKDE